MSSLNNLYHGTILPSAISTTSTISNVAAVKSSTNHNNMQNGIYCRRCGYGGCDVRILDCGCSVHARCLNLTNTPLAQCPYCTTQITGLALYPMTFHEIDNARRTVAAQAKSKRSKKRKNNSDTPMSFDGGENDCRTGRWTPEEMAICDKFIDTFKAGDLPVIDGVKLNDFLASMLKSKQSRLTKKMKNANLSGKQFKKTNGFIADFEQCKQFSELEDAFFRSLSDPQEQASVRFHMQKEWREMFSAYCVNVGQPLDADAWLSSVEEMEKRESVVKDAARMARRKMMMGIALDHDTQNPDSGVFIERSNNHQHTTSSNAFATLPFEQDDFLSLLDDKPSSAGRGASGLNKGKPNMTIGTRHYWHYASPFLGKVISYIQRHGCPFEHVDAWVPSFVPDNEASEGSGTNNSSSCRLCFGGSATADVCIPPDGVGPAQLLPQDEQFNLLSFGDYSQKFSFNVGCGLPGRVYENGIPAWEQSVQNAPNQHFERCGGAEQWGVKTVVGIPVPSPNVGRIVVVVYSRHDRSKDQDLVGRLYDEFKKLIPSPKWKLVVDIGTPENGQSNENDAMHPLPMASDNNSNATNGEGSTDQDKQLNDLVALLGENMPHDQNSPHYSYLSNFMSLRLMLLKPTPSNDELEQRGTLLSSFASYLSSGRSKVDISVMIARDYMFLKQQAKPKPSPRMQAIVPSSNHSIFQSIEQFNLPIQSSSFSTSNVSHNGGQFMPFATTQGGKESAIHQHFSALNNSTQQHLHQQQQHRSIIQQIEAMDASNQNGAILQSSTSAPRMNLDSLTHNDVNVNINPSNTDVPNDGKSES